MEQQLNIFVDEYGTPDPKYNAIKDSNGYFFLCGVVMSNSEVEKSEYLLPEFKMKWFKMSNFSLHFREISKQQGRYRILTNKNLRDSFFQDYSKLLSKINFKIVGSFIGLKEMKNKYAWPAHPYFSSLQIIAERLIFYSRRYKTNKYILNIEGRGKKENKDYKRAIEKLKRFGSADDNLPAFRSSELMNLNFEVSFKGKKDVISGLEIADTIAYCLGSTLRKDTLESQEQNKKKIFSF